MPTGIKQIIIKKEYKKNFNLKPASQTTAPPPIAISIAVPKSGWAATKKTGITMAKRGKKNIFYVWYIFWWYFIIISR